MQTDPPTAEHPRRRLPWLEICAVLATAQVLLAGYRFGVGNQSIQVPFLKHLVDPSLFSRDVLITTLGDYPTLFYQVLARILPSVDFIPAFYMVLHLLTAFLVLAAAFALAQAMAGRGLAGLLMVLFLVAGHQGGIAESGLYSLGFTHTWAALPAALAVLTLALRGRHPAALGLAGLLVNVHALMGLYAATFAGAALLADARRDRRWLEQAILSAALFAGGAGPMLIRVVTGGGAYTGAWLHELRARSAHHVFLSTWWSPGRAALPLFAALAALGALSLGAYRPPGAAARRAAGMAIAGSTLAVAGYVFSDLIPVPIVLRAQLFRSTQLLAALVLAAIAGAVAAVLESPRPPDRRPADAVLAILARTLCVALVLALCIPPLRSGVTLLLLPLAAVWTLQRRLPAWAAAAAGAALFVGVLAWRRISFDPLADLRAAPVWPTDVPPLAWAAVTSALIAALAARAAGHVWLRTLARCLALTVCAAAAVVAAGVSGNRYADADAWVEVQRAARALTPKNAVVLVPAEPGGFRLQSDRAVTGEWRDGTQQFFSPTFSHAWWQRMEAVQPGLTVDPDGRLVSRGGSLADLTGPELVTLATQLRADYAVLPADGRDRRLPVLFANAEWTLVGTTPLPAPPSATSDAAAASAAIAAEERFIRDVVEPNIRRYRQSDATVSVVDAEGRPLKGALFAIRQTHQAFGFGCSLDHFIEPPAYSWEFKAPVVTPQQLERFKEVFNYSVIAYSAKWCAIEPAEGQPQFDNLDRYVAWCATNGIGTQFHFVSGYLPEWMKAKNDAERQALFLAHARRLVERYGDRIRDWQVVNEKHLLAQAPAVIRWMREARPDLHLGIADCGRFYAGRDSHDFPDADTNLLRGMREVRWLRDQGAPVDFFGFHGHRPFGLWADPASIYTSLDACAKDGVRIYITEFGVPDRGPIVGPVRTGEWTPELQAEYYCRFFKVCFSHPAVDGVNIWGMGPRTWIQNAALLDREFQPVPAFHALKRLIRDEWMTRLSGRLPLDGRASFRGFHGTYELAVTPRDGDETRVCSFDLTPGTTNVLRFAWRDGRLTR